MIDALSNITTTVGNTSNDTSSSSLFSGSENKLLDPTVFYNLLITQLQNQDPLEPMKDTEFIAQLAQLATLEETRAMKQAVELLSYSQGAAANAQAVTLLGKYAVQEGNNIVVKKDGSTSKIMFDLEEQAQEASLIIYDEDGKVVNVIPLGALSAGEHSFEWDGKDLNSNNVEPGNYKFEIKAYNGDNEVNVKTYGVYLIDGISFMNGVTVLKSGDLSIDLGSVLEVLI